MLALLGLIVSIALADSLNPATVGPALWLATGRRPLRRVAEFALGFLAVNLTGGVALALGPGRLLLAAVPRPSAAAKHAIELAIGAALLLVAAGLWHGRRRLAARVDGPRRTPRGSALGLGAVLAAVELPTALPYFAVIVAVVGSGAGPGTQVALLALFNAVFLLPVAGILGVLALAGPHARDRLAAAGRRLRAHGPALVAVLLAAAGVAGVVLGTVGLAR